LYVSVNTVPAVFTAEELNVGAVISAVELFDTVFAVDKNDTASLPAES
jgi:hypothetical protein